MGAETLRTQGSFHRRERGGLPALAGSVVLLALAAFPVQAAAPPDHLNYQGVLRDSSGVPLTGSYDMTFRLLTGVMEGASPIEILVDSHVGGAAGDGVQVENGLFSVRIGTGMVTDGSGPGTYTTLAEVFRDHEEVWLSVEVNGEVLAPEIRVAASAYAHNASHFQGLGTDSFLRKDLDELTSGQIWLSRTPMGSGIAHGPLFISPPSANANDTLLGAAVSFSQRFRVDAEGDVFLAGSLFPQGGIFGDAGMSIQGGASPTDTLFLSSGPGFPFGSIFIQGDDAMSFRAGNGSFRFYNAGASSAMASLDALGFLYISSDLTIGDPGEIRSINFPSAGRIFASSLLTSTRGSSQVVFDDDDTFLSVDRASWWHHGGPGSVDGRRLAEIDEIGNMFLRGTLSESQFGDLAESFLASGPIQPGELVSVSERSPETVRRSVGAGDQGLLGVVSTAPGILLRGAPLDVAMLERVWGRELRDAFLADRSRLREQVLVRYPATAAEMPDRAAAEARLDELALQAFWRERSVPVALAGRVPVQVDSRFGAIRAGDPIGPSPIPGVGARASVPGPIVGTALEPFDAGRGSIQVLVHRGFLPAVPGEDAGTGGAVPGTDPAPGPAARTLPAPADPALRGAAGVQILSGPALPRTPGDGRPELLPLGEAAGPGDVLVAGLDQPGMYALGRRAGDPAVVGVVVAHGPEVAPALGASHASVAVAGIIQVKVDADHGSILAGDLLMSSPTPGHAMRADDPLPGTVLGKALEGLPSGTGSIQMLVMMR